MRIRPLARHPLNNPSLFCLTTGLAICLTTSAASAASWLVHDVAEFTTAASALQPGDEIVLADGTWTDARLLLKGQGTAAAPIVLRAQTAGKVVLSGRSDLRLAGSYLQVSNLVFRNGYTPGDAVVAFRESSKAVARHSRVTGLVIDDYTNPDASDQDYWVSLYGSNNRLDHSQLRGKTNAGPTVVVVRDATQGLDNQHRIDHNWFGPRPALGVNGGETLRVGTSDTSLSDSNSTVENNWFEGCDGETEIISNKSGGNTYRGNVFYRSAGALTLRHGNGNRVIDNVFLGDDVYVTYTRFESASRQVVETIRLLPLERPEARKETKPGRVMLYGFSPPGPQLLGRLLPLTMKVRLYQCFIDAAVSEQVARMVAMKAATDAAGSMIRSLTQHYNRARQSQITLELLDIVGGADALK